MNVSSLEPRPDEAMSAAAISSALVALRPRRRRRPLVGGMLLLWCVWMMGSWLGVMEAMYGRWAPATAPGSLMPAGRWMVIQGLVGLLIAWPAVRLTGVGGTWATGGDEAGLTWWARTGWVLRDWFYLNVLHAAVLISVKLGAHWTGEQTLLVIGWCAAWSLGAGVVLAWGMGGPIGRRTWSMAGCVGVALGGGVLAALLGGGLIAASEPWRTGWMLADKWPAGPTTWAWRAVGIAAGAAAGAWVAASAWAWGRDFQRTGARK
ncbi:MAG: hypothetical protein IT442_01900 [Phycisphaeraceae bacterium]|nr:hypothetical protein [Phycisphaeraceae bacterium]